MMASRATTDFQKGYLHTKVFLGTPTVSIICLTGSHDLFQSSYLLTRAHFKVISLYIQECDLLGKWFLCGWGFSQQLSSIICTGVLSFMFCSLRKSIQENIQKNIQNLFKIWAKSIQIFSVKSYLLKRVTLVPTQEHHWQE